MEAAQDIDFEIKITDPETEKLNDLFQEHQSFTSWYHVCSQGPSSSCQQHSITSHANRDRNTLQKLHSFKSLPFSLDYLYLVSDDRAIEFHDHQHHFCGSSTMLDTSSAPIKQHEALQKTASAMFPLHHSAAGSARQIAPVASLKLDLTVVSDPQCKKPCGRKRSLLRF